MVKWLCTVCNIYIYDEEKGDTLTGIRQDMKVSDFPDSWRCPVCGAKKDKLIQISEDEYRQKAKAFSYFMEKKEERRGILVGVDNPETTPESRQEYGISLGLRGIGQGISYLNNFKSLSKYQLKKKLITEHEDPVIETTFFGKNISMPCLVLL